MSAEKDHRFYPPDKCAECGSTFFRHLVTMFGHIGWMCRTCRFIMP